ncbi:MAG: glycosyltransferase [Arachidicoccus sp.]|nr:glycosyltransferase [Arachidicoccus sp.]
MEGDTNNTMRILRVITSMNPANGGPSQGIRNMVPALEKLGIANEIVTFDNPSDTFLHEESLTIHALGEAKNPYQYTSALNKWLETYLGKYDVVIIHGLWLYNSYGTYLSWRRYKRKSKGIAPELYVMPHGMLDPWFQQAPERKLKALRNTIVWRLFEQKVVNGADGLLFTCEEELLLARTTFPGYHPKKEINIGYGVKPPPPYTEELIEHKPAQKPYFLFLSRIHPKKGTDLLIRAYMELKTTIPDLPQLVIAGPGLDTAYGKQLAQLAETCTSILFPGMLKGKDKWAAFYGCEAFILPSHQENFGIAIVEALACGKPVIITDKVNIWREIKKGGGGLVSKDTYESVFAALKQWIEKSALERQTMATRAADTYKELYAIEPAAEKFKRELSFTQS